MKKTLPDISGSTYITPEKRNLRANRRKLFKGPFWMYSRYAILVIWSGIKFLFTKDPQAAVTLQALRVMRIVERQGAHFTIEGLHHFPREGGPYVFACNHMGTLEVNSLPGLIASRTPMTFVVKKSLLEMPFFGKVLQRLRAITVERKHPGEDLKFVLEKGSSLLAEGVSVILFPEGTRQETFDPRRFNSLAIKLAIAGNAKVVPVALKTDFWGVGEKVKEFGNLFPDKPVHITFGEPLTPQGRGKAEQIKVTQFISENLKNWGASVTE